MTPFLQVVWTDDVTGRPGYLVIDRLGRGVSSGGLRMRAGVTLDEVADLARGMSRKEAIAYEPGLAYQPLGGAKGGIDCDPLDPDATGMLRRYIAAMKPLLATYWATGEDLGLRQESIEAACHAAGLRTSIDAVLPLLDDPDTALKRLDAAFAVTVDGIGLGDLAGGCGVAESALTAVDRLGIRNPTAVIQGFGSMGGATARFLARAGVRVVGVADTDGLLTDPGGLDVEALLRTRDPFGRVPGDKRPRDEWLDVDCDLLIPAAVSYSIGLAEAHRVRARLVVEAANVPVTPEAERVLTGRGVVVIPDVVANSATNSWWWWTLFGDIPADADASFAKIRSWMRRVTTEIMSDPSRTPREVAHALSAHNMAAQR
ncbi:Glu/Leu/Phe/Val dehydrogenase dimerization domain-containing protein [Herbidospora mongoliensis]|uniref:Glu/Leu/Phe/Val dehydrogenase dimerization domain-containing protein n=1 Tax=Herbidospora mongoliensis TaxID=688067 RepID=UPI0008341517|nr:Glu/Leu/Phe/Val dehydrogenase dimerization domain-containing protein [Herbidospora mongoliensis]